MVEIEKLRNSIRGLESQRAVLGDEIINPAISALQQQLSGLEQQATAQAAPAEERRMVSILFFDLVGSTSLAEKLDPEEYRHIVSQLHTALGEAITTQHGTVAQYFGDGLLAFFGSKQSSEHDPENAIRAALDGHAAVANLQLSEKLQLRAGIHTGLVVVGELGDSSHKEFTASGDAVNLAARLQSAAPPGGTLISHDTYRYVRGIFDLTPRAPLTVKGKSEPVQTYLVRRAKPRPFRSITRGVAGVETRTIGREAEMQALQVAYLKAYEGHGIVWSQLVSEPGVGKSRLVADMTDWLDLRDETYRLLRARAFPDDANQPYALIRRLWFDRFQIAEDAPLEQAQARWVERFREFSGLLDYEEPAHALGLLVGLPFADSPDIKGMRNDPMQVKGRATVVSREVIKTIRQHFPVVFLLEDLQSTDAASWDYLLDVSLDEREAEQPNGLFILATARPEWQSPKTLSEFFKSPSDAGKSSKIWGTLLKLESLSDHLTRELTLELLQRVEDIPRQVIDLLVERSEGVPYFTEEMVNWFIDHGILDTSAERWRFLPDKLKEQPLPATLQHLLLTRLSNLSPTERAALQRGAIFGRRFWSGGVEALGVSAGSEVFGHLQPRGFVEVQPESSFQGDTEWSFHQNLLQEVTYESVLKRERSALHKVAASWLEKQARQADRLEEFAGLLGDHCERAGELSVAADWYMVAARRAYNQGAIREACDFYTRALGLLPPVDRERRWQALLGREDTLSILGDAQPWEEDINALLDLAKSFEDENYLAEAYYRRASYFAKHGDNHITKVYAQEALIAARHCGNEAIEANALALSTMASTRTHGGIGESEADLNEAVRIARRLGDDNVLANVLQRAANAYNSPADLEKSISLQSEVVKLHHQLGNRIQEARGLVNIAWLYGRLGLYKQARPLYEQARVINETLGVRRVFAYNLANLGDLAWKTGDLRNARRLLEQSYLEISPSQDAYGKILILVDLGIVLLKMGDPAAAYRRFREAYELATQFKSDQLVCQSASGLAACALMQGQLEEARKYAEQAWEYLKVYSLEGLENPAVDYRACAEVFDALGEPEMVQVILESGYRALMEAADKITVPEWRQSFLENEPENRGLIEMWERRK